MTDGMNRRRFFKVFAVVTAAVATSPRLLAGEFKRKLVPFWVETSQHSWFVDDAYSKELERLKVGSLYDCKVNALAPEQIKHLFLRSETFESFDKRNADILIEQMGVMIPRSDLYDYLTKFGNV